MSIITVIVGGMSFVAGLFAGYLGGQNGSSQLAMLISSETEAALSILSTTAVFTLLVLLVRMPFIQRFLFPAYDDYAKIVSKFEHSKVTAVEAELAKSFALSSTLGLVGILIAIGIVVAAQIIALR